MEIKVVFPKKAIVKIADLTNASFRLKYVSLNWKVAEVIMIAKTDKPQNEVLSHRLIYLLPELSTLFEKLVLKKLKPII